MYTGMGRGTLHSLSKVMLQNNQKDNSGFSLVELLIVIVIIGIMTAMAMQSMDALVGDAREIKTEREMEMLAKAILGDPSVMSGGTRSDFGYVGDVGAFPSSLQDLYENPGGYSTWDGPYIQSGFTEDSTGFKLDEWGTAYGYSGGTTITSTGGGTTITKRIADASSDYLLNTFTGEVRDSSGCPPGTPYEDSINVVITIPNGSGSTVNKTYSTDSAGTFVLDSIPVGNHPLRIIFTPTSDTLFRHLNTLPRHRGTSTEYRFASAHFPPGSVELDPGSEKISTNKCDQIEFDIVNNDGCAAVVLSSIKLTWASPEAYYEKVIVGGVTVFDQNTPRSSTNDVSIFSSSQTVNAGATVTVQIQKFRADSTGGSSAVSMANTTFTVLFSDGSTFDVSVGDCSWKDGPNYAGTSGTNNFTDPDSALGSGETSCATFTGTTQDGYWNNFGFAIPGGSIIDGIEVECKRSWVTTAPASTTPGVNVGKDESTMGTEKIDNNLAGTSSQTCGAGQVKKKVGGKTDLWGLTWTVAEINSSNFTVRLRNADAASFDWHVNWIKVSVYYH